MANTRVVALCLVSFACLLCVMEGVQVTITNNCGYTVWPGSQANQGSPQLSKTGFELASQKSESIDVPAKWSGKFWARTGCSNNNGVFSCATADCGNHVECGGAGEATPASLMEFTVDTNGDHDTYDVSNVDGFNIPSSITPQGGTGTCKVASCPANINAACPSDLQFKGSDGSVVGCKSACVAYGKPEYCCSAPDHNKPETCPPSNYSKFFSKQCPNAYSYAYDDNKGTFTCSKPTAYAIKLCP
ncbi:hypothetical protein PIB30_025660 [Stylosanthes scabra]|uniref:Thaumatin-like protein n=1 Tax=Stylosanthes scabra TaxID=79078 RepID=A0ABU6WD65_9FABA|nr:hypothetical protein [Stylosanthes scabra]